MGPYKFSPLWHNLGFYKSGMMKFKHLKFNSPAPDLQLASSTGETIQLSSLWSRQPLLLVFTRHFGCTQCKEMLDVISDGRDAIQKAGLRIAVITQGTPETAAEFCAKYAPGLFCLADPHLSAYQAYGLERGNLFQVVLNPRVWSAVSKARKKGYLLEPPPQNQDAMQMSGLFIIGVNGRIELPYYYDNIADHPSFDLLVKGVLSTGWNRPFDGPLGPTHSHS